MSIEIPVIYKVTIGSTEGQETTYLCGGASDQQALIYAGKVVEAYANRSDPNARVRVLKDGEEIGPATTMADMTRRAV